MIKSCRTLTLSFLTALTAATLMASARLTPLAAQGVTTGAISGIATDSAGNPIENVQIQVVNRSTGFTSGGLSAQNGRFFVPGLEVGGPYTVTARLIGFTPQTRENLNIFLGQNLRVEFRLIPQVVTLAAVEVTAGPESPVFTKSKTGISTTISDSLLRRAPTLNRNFTDFIRTAPQVSSSGPGFSGGGVNNRFNNIQIDGASANDLFGLGSTGQPGGQARGKSIPLEAVKEYQVLLSPFDVRQGNFAGILINAVTKSGTNEFQGTAFYYTRNEEYARNTAFIRNSRFDHTQYGFALGGPVVKNRMHFFVAPEWQERQAPAGGPYLGQPATQTPSFIVAKDTVDRFTQLLQTYGLSAGSAGQVTNENPLNNFFGRVDVQFPGWNSRAVLRYNYGEAQDQNFSRSLSTNNPGYGLTSNAFQFKSVTHQPVFQFFTNLRGGASNELIVGYNRIRDARTPGVVAPSIEVNVNRGTTATARLIAGSEQFSQGNELDQDIFEITDNLTFSRGTHRITFGTKNEFYKIRNLFTESSYGVYTFANLDSLRTGQPESYRISKDLGGGVEARFRAASFGGYVQDQWAATDNLSFTLGLRADVPIFQDKPTFARVVDSVYGRRTDVLPSGNLQFSPRIGFNWDISGGEQTEQLRGGVGLFQGRPAFVWLGNAFQNNGAGLGFLNCGLSTALPGRAPRFNPDPTQQPTACANGQGLSTGVVGPVNLLDEDLRFPQTLRASLGYDRQIPGGFVATIEGLYTLGVNNFFYINRNLKEPQGTDRNGRVVYGQTIATSGQANPDLVDRNFSEVIDVTNQSKDYAYNVTGQLQKRFTSAFEARASYTYSQARDVQSLTSSRAISNWRFGRTLAGDQNQQNTGISLFDQPHRVVLTGTYTARWPVANLSTDVSVIYNGESGPPFDYVYTGASGRGDLNADGVNGNDLIYIPTRASDPAQILFQATSQATIARQQAAFDNFIDNSDCLREQRGRIIERNSCRSPFQHRLDMTLRQNLPPFRGNTVTLQVDAFNVLNYVGTRFKENWGQLRFAGDNSNVSLLTQVAQTAGSLVSQAGPLSGSQGIFTFNPNQPQFTSLNLSSNYQFQFSVRYSFY